MQNIEKLMKLASLLSSDGVDQLIKQAELLQNIEAGLQSSNNQQKRTRGTEPCPSCPNCKGTSVVRDGKQHYWCKACKRSFVSSTNTVMSGSHFGKEIREGLINDTFDGKSIDYSATRFQMHHETAFNMRHKVLLALQYLGSKDPVILQNIAELDETYVLESEKGTKFTYLSPREPRKRGSKAKKRGLSEEQICICTGVERNKGSAYAVTVNRAKPSNDEIRQAFSDHIEEGAVLFTDGLKGYGVLMQDVDCVVNGMSVEDMKKPRTASLNNVNSFHSFIKDRYHDYRGVASKYINRYNVLFAKGFRDRQKTVEELTNVLLTVSNEDLHILVNDLALKDLASM